MKKIMTKPAGNSSLWKKLSAYEAYLRQEERSKNTILKYLRDIQSLLTFLNGSEPSRDRILEWKEYLTFHYSPASVNSMLAAVNSFFSWLDLSFLRVKPLKIQHDVFAAPEKELTRVEYIRLVRTAEAKGNQRLSLILQTICATGIRVSELCFITAEAVSTGRAEVNCKGKRRTVFLPQKLCRILKRFLRQQKRTAGPVFVTKNKKPLDRSNIWRDMKLLSSAANVEPGKIFPHNLRHLFARLYYSMEKDLSRLADILGHTSVNTTRIYTAESGTIHARQLGRLGLIVT